MSQHNTLQTITCHNPQVQLRNFSLSEFPQDLGSQLAAITELLQNQQAEIASLKDAITASEAKHLTAIENLETEVLS